MLGDRQVGPMTLEELADLGIRPDTYIWCKGMPDWERADENGDVCRFFRRRLAQGLAAGCNGQSIRECSGTDRYIRCRAAKIPVLFSEKRRACPGKGGS